MDNGYILTVIDSKVGIGFEMYGWHRCHGRFQISDDESQAEIYDYMDEAERDRDMFLEAVRSRFPGEGQRHHQGSRMKGVSQAMVY
jgi:hypothetical protein